MWELRACRGCLSVKTKLEKYNENTKKIYTCITGLAIEDTDGYPNFFCVECLALMKKVVSFRRKMRRAFYVMKEIMIKKKQITHYDITTVNRRRTNLRSAIGYWNSRSSGFFTIDNTEQGKDNIEQGTGNVASMEVVKPIIANIALDINNKTDEKSIVLHQYKPLSSGHVRHIIDVEPEIIHTKVEVPEEDTGQCEEIQEDVKKEINEEPQDLIDDNNEDIDLTNVFEDFVDNEPDDSDYSLKDEFPKEDKETKQKKADKKRLETETKELKRYKYPIYKASKMLSVCDIEVLAQKEQFETFELLKSQPPFSTSTYKCGLCLTVYETIDLLMEHVAMHNNNLHHDFVCPICFLRFATDELLEMHHVENHKYLYKCRKCDGLKLCKLADVINHADVHKFKKASETDFEIRNKDMFNIIKVSSENMQLKMAHPDSNYECFKCNMRFDTPNLLMFHGRRHIKSAKKMLMCDICYTWHKNRKKLQKHMSIWHLYIYECIYCPEKLFNRLEAKHHRMTHKDVHKISCVYCDRLLNAVGLVYHKMKYHYAETYKDDCVVCGRSFISAEKLYIHQFQEHGIISINDLSCGDPEARCKVCNVQFLSVQSYKKHAVRKWHEDAMFFENTCTSCHKMFETTEEYERHMTAKHKSGPTYPRKCSYCDRIFNQPGLFFRHQAKEHSDKPSEYSNTPKLCEVCGATVFLMRKHMRLHTQGIITFKCEYCNVVKQFPHPTLLARHVVAKHTPFPHICSICDRGFNGRQECLDHILKLHAPEKPFTCEFCSRSFSHMDYLRDHARNSHKVIIKRVSEYSSMLKSNLVVYPHLKLNLSLIKPNILTSVRIKLSNYGNSKMVTLEKSKVKDYLVLDKGNEILDGSVPKKRRTKWDMKDLDCDEIDAKKRRVVKKEDDIITTTKIIKPMVKKVMVKQNKIKEEVIHDNSEVLDDNHSFINDNSEIVYDNSELVHDSFGVVDDSGDVINEDSGDVIKEDSGDVINEDSGDVIKEDSGDVINEDSGENLVINEPLQVYEKNNEQFVYINGVVYKVETED